MWLSSYFLEVFSLVSLFFFPDYFTKININHSLVSEWYCFQCHFLPRVASKENWRYLSSDSTFDNFILMESKGRSNMRPIIGLGICDLTGPSNGNATTDHNIHKVAAASYQLWPLTMLLCFTMMHVNEDNHKNILVKSWHKVLEKIIVLFANGCLRNVKEPDIYKNKVKWYSFFQNNH